MYMGWGLQKEKVWELNSFACTGRCPEVSWKLISNFISTWYHRKKQQFIFRVVLLHRYTLQYMLFSWNMYCIIVRVFKLYSLRKKSSLLKTALPKFFKLCWEFHHYCRRKMAVSWTNRILKILWNFLQNKIIFLVFRKLDYFPKCRKIFNTQARQPN